MKRILALTLTLIILLLTSCVSWWGNEVDDNGPYKGMTAKQIFDQSQEAIAKKEYSAAVKRLEALETMYPFSEYAEKAQLDLIHAYYQKEDYPSAAATAERFIHLYPRAKNVDYAYYMKALANFQQNRGTFANILPLDESWREPGTQAQAYADFAVLVQRFPESKYKNNALQRMIYLRNMFAQRELNTANYYFERNRYVAAAERASFLIKNYPQAPSVQPALIILYRANKALGLHKAADDALQVYQATYHSLPTGITS
ncbi:competence lipoprotein comL precursor [Legionella busanensis]|uniref:Outer membrane protein assembly factor BamD n=1 Tax=Legionella busanensis TaxID=190655 RepID=A0A378JKL2_9GAMM|nr:outer membrane protein assembly factor BamD [Legionella busanensis]STX51866.1 competence lipoprotein comL precursor [Legionella busanensis]